MGSSASGDAGDNSFTSIRVGTNGAQNRVEGDGTHSGGGSGQVHVWANAGDDTIGLAFEDITTYKTGHHARGDQKYFTNGLYADTFNFKDLTAIKNGGIAVGRLEDFDLTRDTVQIEGNDIDLTRGSGVKAGFSWKVIMWDADPNDSATGEQQWLYIDTGSGHLFYALEGARVAPDGDGGANAIYDSGVRVGGAQEDHFIKEANLPLDFASLTAVGFVDPENHVPAGAVAQGGMTINDYDDSEAPVYNQNGVLTLPGGDLSTPISGSALGDLIAAGLNDDIVNAGDGNDQVWGGRGDDTIHGENGNDTLRGGTGYDSIVGGDGADLIFGNTGSDILRGGWGDDTLYGGAGNDLLVGDKDEDLLFGGAGDDTLMGGTYADTLSGGDGNDLLQGGDGSDDLGGGKGNDVLAGDKGNDTLNGWGGNDWLGGGAGDDSLQGGAGNDTLFGGSGQDVLNGGAGADVFVFKGDSDWWELIEDFTDGIDSINLSQTNAASFGDLTISYNSGSNVTIVNYGNGSFIVEGNQTSLLDASDFIF